VNNQQPLAERMRPNTLAQFIGQSHLISEGKPIRLFIERGQIPSMILWGPPGVGKTTLANIIAREAGLPFHQLSAISSGVKELRDIIQKATEQGNVILFIDEIHRFNKAQQDALLGAVEKGIVTLIGATTENPSFEVVGALLSRCQVYVLKELNAAELMQIANQAVVSDARFVLKKIQIQDYEALIRFSGGDARRLLNVLELVVESATTDEIIISNEITEYIIQKKIARYDKSGEQHYDLISAFIKSIRGSDPNAAVYYLARMIDAGEEPSFIARRMLILASEDIGNANPTALVMATNCFQATEVIGYPESRIILSQCAIYLASSPKSNAAYVAIEEALAEVSRSGDLSVPLHLRNAPTRLMKELNYGKDYAYAHHYEGNFVPLEYMPESIAGKKFYEPGPNAREMELRAYLKSRWKDKYGY
jgi:putative ATPase